MKKTQEQKNAALRAWFVKLQFARELLDAAQAKSAGLETCWYSHRKTA